MVNYRLFVTACYLAIAQLCLSQDQIVLDKLSDCEGLAEIRTKLDSPVSRDCRLPHGRIESTVISIINSNAGARLCLLSFPPMSRLAGFSCIDVAVNGGDREITCFRAVHDSLLDRYQKDFDAVYNERAVRYKNAASNCTAGNGDASTAPNSIFPSVMYPVAKPRFGFGLGIGNDRKGEAYHGYAALNPDVDDQGLGALEVFDMFRLRHATAHIVHVPVSSGKIELEINDLLEARALAADKMSHQFGLPVIATIRAIDLRYGGPKDVPMDKRGNDLGAWQEGIGVVIEEAGFRELSAMELSKLHFDPDDMGTLLAGSLPFGQRGSLRASPRVVVRIDDRYDSCTAFGEVLVIEPEKGVKEDYGSIAILLMGVGDCGRNAEGDVLDALLDKSTEYLRNQVNQE